MGYVYNRYNYRNELERTKMLFPNLEPIEFFNNGEVLLQCKVFDIFPKCGGMSGAPIINEECKLCGMIVKANEKNRTFTALPVHQIISMIKGEDVKIKS